MLTGGCLILIGRGKGTYREGEVAGSNHARASANSRAIDSAYDRQGTRVNGVDHVKQAMGVQLVLLLWVGGHLFHPIQISSC